MNWSEFVKNIQQDFRLSDTDFENVTGVSRVILHRIRNGETKKPNQYTIKRLEEGLGIKINDSDQDNITYNKVKEPKAAGFEGEIPVSKIPLLSEVYAGEPEYLDTEFHDEFHYFVNMKPSHRCFALRVSGKSMETTLKDGSIVIVDMDANYKEGDIVAVRLKNGEQYIKRFYDMNYAFIKLTSDNSDYGVRLIDKEHIDKIYKVASAIFDPNER